MIRAASASDIPAIISMGRLMHAESPRYRGMDFDPERVRALAEHCIGDGTVVVAEADVTGLDDMGRDATSREKVGMAAISPCFRFFNNDTYYADLIVYLLPDYRRGRLAAALVEAVEAIAGRNGGGELVLGVTTGVANEQVARLYERLGYHRVGVVMAKDIQPNA